MENEIDYNAQLAPSALNQPYQAKEQEEQFPTDYNPNLNQAIGDTDPNEWSDTHTGAQIQSYSPEQQQAMQNQILARTDAQVRRNEGLAQQQINDRLFASIETDSNAKAQELNSKINEIDNPKNLSEAELIKNAYDIQMPQGASKYEKYYYEPRRNTGIAYFDNKKELSILDAYIAKHFLGIDVKYTFLKHHITGDLTLKHQNQGQAIKKAQDDGRVVDQFLDSSMALVMDSLAQNKYIRGGKHTLYMLFGKSFDSGTQDHALWQQRTSRQYSSLLTRSGLGDRIPDMLQKDVDNLTRGRFMGFESYLAVNRSGLDMGIKNIESDIAWMRSAGVPEERMQGLKYKLQAGRVLQSMTADEIKADPTKYITSYLRYKGESPAQIREKLKKTGLI